MILLHVRDAPNFTTVVGFGVRSPGIGCVGVPYGTKTWERVAGPNTLRDHTHGFRRSPIKSKGWVPLHPPITHPVDNLSLDVSNSKGLRP